MSETSQKGKIGVLNVALDSVTRGYKVFVPFLDDDCPYDLIIERHGKLERVQVKYHVSKGVVVELNWDHHCGHKKQMKYEVGSFDYMAVFEQTSGTCYYVPNTVDRPTCLRLTPTVNSQVKNVKWAKDYRVW